MAKNPSSMTYRPGRDGVAKTLGELGGQIMELLWELESGTVRDVHDALSDRQSQVAYSTVKTVMTRLHEKGSLDRVLEGKGYRYTPTTTREDFIAHVSHDVVRGVLHDLSGPALSAFVDDLDSEDIAKLDELARLIKKRRTS